MFWNILNSVPVIGHIKGVAHYMVGDFEGGNKAIYEATRSGAVLMGGLVGVGAGPMGVAASAVTAGIIVDLLTSYATGTPEGLLAGLDDVLTDILNGEVPTESLVNLTVFATSDAIGGLGGGAVDDTITTIINIMGKDTGKKISIELLKTKTMLLLQLIFTHSFARTTITENVRRRTRQPAQNNNTAQKKNKSKSKSGATGTSSGSDPPKKNEIKLQAKPQVARDTHWTAFLNIFKVNSLDAICMGIWNTPLFKGLEDGQKRSLKKLIGMIRRQGDTYFLRVIRIVAKLFDKFDEKDVTFQNFISLVSFVMTYVGEEVAQRNELSRREAESDLKPFEDRLKSLVDSITAEVLRDISVVWLKYKGLKQFMSLQCTRVWPTFRDITSAVAHYYKHRLIQEQGRVLSTEEYFDLINSFLNRVHKLSQFSELFVSRRELVYERYMIGFGRRGRLVLQVQDNSLELSSFYFLDSSVEGDQDGDEYVDGVKLETAKQ